MGPIEALKLALAKEIEAAKLYERLSVDHPTVRDILDFLIIEEQKHRKLIEKKIVEMTK